ncbi:MAG TPA: hypothetical protein VFP44_23120 [Usitatibacter sp.]|nr:hypothetical protein [Usitatibacter sp.]
MGLLNRHKLLAALAVMCAIAAVATLFATRNPRVTAKPAVQLSWNPAMPAATDTKSVATPMQTLATRLAQRLESSRSNDGEAWTLLARAYVELRRPEEAVAAFERARALLGDGDAQRLADHAAALSAARGSAAEAEVRALREAAARQKAASPAKGAP